MMGVKEINDRSDVKNISLDDLVPKNHLIRKIDKAIDLSFIRDKVSHLYGNTGVKSIDPVVLFKIIMIQYIFGIRSMRQTIREIEVNMAYRWYLGYGINEKIPHFSTFGKNYQRRFQNSTIFEDIFIQIIDEIKKCKFLNTENIFIDGTHVKASANNKKAKNQLVVDSVKFYENELQKEIEIDRISHKKKL